MMIKRALLVALWCACAGALGSLIAGDDDCALHITGPGRTSAYDYSINLLKGNFGYDGQANCITYEAINQAYLEARNRILVSQPKGDWKAEDFASVGELILDISINLARRYGLTYEEIEKGLPLIDTSRTLIREVCPPVFSHVECRAGKYRRLDGLCNNLQHPTWGATMAPFQRLIGPLFADGINAPRISHTGHDLPLSRVVSRTMHPDDGFHDHAGTVMVIAWGQFMDHDYTLTGTPLDPINRNDPEECCKRPQHLKHPYCNEIRIPDDDYFYRLFGVKCIDFVRGFPSPRPGCRLGSRVPFNTLTGAIDGNTVYGVTEKFSRKLRTGFGGLLRMNPVFKEYGLKDLLPLKLDIPDEGCTRPNKNMYCFEAGEIRVNEQLVLTVMHTLMAREHNRVANALAEVNPHWDDETLFQEARRINIAEIQHITYNEFLPILLGKDVMEKFGLVLEKEGYWDGYDSKVNPDVLASFAAAAYRFGHSLLPTAVERWSKAHKFIASKRLSDLIRRPYDLYRAGVLDEYVMGLMNQVAQAMDDSITQEVTNHLFKKVGARFGMDLVSFNMQRGREFGLPGYMEFRKFCGLPGADSFQELFGSMSNHTVRKYETIFEHPIDVDLWSGGVSERPLPGSMLGPTFACVIATQFSYSRRGDRFWFELPNQPSSFTSEQLVELRKARLARVICDNTDIIDTVQLYPMVLPDHELNPRVPCRSGIIPSMDFSKWAEPGPFRGAAKQFQTELVFLPTQTPILEKATVIMITDAIIIEKNQTSNEVTTKSDNYEEQDATQDVQQNNACNSTESASNAKDCDVPLQAQNTTNCSNAQNGSLSIDCNTDNGAKNNKHDIKTNEIPDSDTVLKYVYKKNEKTESNDKTKGHLMNRLRRRKRSPSGNSDENDEDVTSSSDYKDDVVSSPSSIKSAPLIVDYETNHRPGGRITWLTSRDNPNIIRGPDLDDFNLEAIHERLRKDEEFIKNSGKHASEADHLNDHNNEKDKYKVKENNDTKQYDNENNKSNESGNYREREDITYPVSREDSRENSDHHSRNNSTYFSPTENRGIEESREANSRESRENLDIQDDERLASHEKEQHRQEATPYDLKSYPNDESKENLERHPKDHYTQENFKPHDDRYVTHAKEHHRQDTPPYDLKPYANSGETKEKLERHPKDHYKEENFKPHDNRYVTHAKEHHRQDDTPYDLKPYPNSGETKEKLERHPKDHYKEENFKPRDDRHDSHGKEHYRQEVKPYDLKLYPNNGESKESSERQAKDHYTEENIKPRDDRNESNEKEHYKHEAKPYDLKPLPYSGESKGSLERQPKDHYPETFKPRDDRHDIILRKDHFRQAPKPYDLKPYPNSGKSKESSERQPKEHYTDENFKPQDDDSHDSHENEHHRLEATPYDLKPYHNSGKSKESSGSHPNDNFAKENFKPQDDRHNRHAEGHYRQEPKPYDLKSFPNNGESKESLEIHPKDDYAEKNFQPQSDRHDSHGKNHYRQEPKPYDLKSFPNNGESKESLEIHPKDDHAGKKFKPRDDRHDSHGKDHYRQEAKPYDFKPYPNIGEGKVSLEQNPNDYYSIENLKPRDNSHDSHEKEHYRQETKPYEPRSEDKSFENNERNYPHSEPLGENGKESNEEIKPQIRFHKNYKNNHANIRNVSSPAPIQEVDLGDFSFERIQVDENEALIPSKENFVNVNPDSAIELLTPIVIKPKFETQKFITHQKIDKDGTAPNIENSKYRNELININDGEVKPVVEISTENDSSELSEENSKVNSSTESESLESLLGGKQIESSDQKEKIIVPKHQDIGDVKQEFERIPLNYKHHDDQTQKRNTDTLINDAPKDENINLPNNDGTLDVFAPNNVQYDENLNIKFDDVAVKLPEIKLPDDILAYARENSPFKDELNDKDEPIKSPFYTNNNEEKDEHTPKTINNYYNSKYKDGDTKEKSNDEHEGEVEDETEHEYDYKPYYEDAEAEKSQEYKKDEPNENEEDEDLYEKFVRERFGKQGTFEKRSEQLRDARETPINPKLYKTIQNILNKTAEIEKQAEKSGDPNAGYMWTLEYGENL